MSTLADSKQRPGRDERAAFSRQVLFALHVLKGRWTLPILCAMNDGPVRLSNLQRDVPGASKKGLTANLRTLERAHIVIRQDLSETLLHVEYRIAEPMREPLNILLIHLADWGKQLGSTDSHQEV